jgi:hypothetical protein
MTPPRAIEVTATVTITNDCLMSCEVFDNELQFTLGNHHTSLLLYTDWPALTKLTQLINQIHTQAATTPHDQAVRFTIAIDQASQQEHTPRTRK